MQLDGLYRALSPVVHGDIVLSINTIQKDTGMKHLALKNLLSSSGLW